MATELTQSEAIINTALSLATIQTNTAALPASPYPLGATALMDSSGNKANASAAATLAAASGKTTYIAGFSVTGAGATVGIPVTVTVAGPATTLSYTYTATAGALLANQPLVVAFNPPVPASATNTAIVVTCPALGTGATTNAVSAFGYRV